MPSAQQGKVQGIKTWVQGFAGPQEKLSLGLQIWFGLCNSVGARGAFGLCGNGGLICVKMGNLVPVGMGFGLCGWFSPWGKKQSCPWNTPNLLLI